MTGPSMIPPDAARRLADELAALRTDVDALKRSGRRSQLTHSSLQDTAFNVYFGDEVRARIGMQSDGQAAVAYMGGDPPPAPTQPVVSARQLGFVVGWYGTFEGGVAAPSNLQRVDVHVSETQGFVPSGDTAWVSLMTQGAVALPGDVDVKYVRLVAVSHAQVASEPSIESQVTPLPADQIAAGSIGANELAADIILASRLRMQDESGDTTLDLDGDTGSILMLGEFRTAPSGERLVIPAGMPEIRAYPATEGRYARLYAGTYPVGGVDYARMSLDSAVFADGGRAHIAAAPDGAFLTHYNVPGGHYWSYVLCTNPNVTVAGSQVLLQPLTSAGAVISPAVLQCRPMYPENRPTLRSPSANVALVWSIPEQDMAVVNHAGTAFRPLRASIVTETSGRARKRKVRDLPGAALTIIRGAPSKQWEFAPAPDGDDRDEVPAEPPQETHIGPMADDLPEWMIRRTSTDPADLGVNVGDRIGLLWKAVEEIADRLDAIETRLPARP